VRNSRPHLIAGPLVEVYTGHGRFTKCESPNSLGPVLNGFFAKHKRKRTSAGVRDSRFFLATHRA
jgi:hypothetical protein